MEHPDYDKKSISRIPFGASATPSIWNHIYDQVEDNIDGLAQHFQYYVPIHDYEVDLSNLHSAIGDNSNSISNLQSDLTSLENTVDNIQNDVLPDYLLKSEFQDSLQRNGGTIPETNQDSIWDAPMFFEGPMEQHVNFQRLGTGPAYSLGVGSSGDFRIGSPFFSWKNSIRFTNDGGLVGPGLDHLNSMGEDSANFKHLYEDGKRVANFPMISRMITRNWKGYNSSVANNLNSVAWSPELGLFAAVGQFPFISEDGINWVSRQPVFHGGMPIVEFTSIVWSPERSCFLAVSSTSTSSQDRIMTSYDGHLWGSGITAPDAAWNSVIWAPGLNIFVAVAGAGGSNDRIMTSPTGLSWVSRYSQSDISLKDVAYSPGLNRFVAVGSSMDFVLNSTNGTTWTESPPMEGTYSLNSVEWSPELNAFVAVGNNRIMASSDGIFWGTVSQLPGDWRSVKWFKELGQFVAVSSSGPETSRVLISRDGINWARMETPVVEDGGYWEDLDWSPELNMIVAVSRIGNNNIMTTL